MANLIIMMEKYDEETHKGARYEYWLTPIKESNVSNKIARYEIRYDSYTCNGTGGTASYSNHMYNKNLESELDNLIKKGFKEVTHETKRFA